jgi:hypothetical protein
LTQVRPRGWTFVIGPVPRATEQADASCDVRSTQCCVTVPRCDVVADGVGVQAVVMRAFAARVVSGLFAVSWLVLPGFGAIDLSVTWSADWPQVLEAGWGLFATVIVAAPFALLAGWPRAVMSGAAQLAIAILCLSVSAIVAHETRLLLLVALLVLQTAILVVLLGGAGPMGPTPWRPVVGSSRLLFLLAVAGAIPWLSYALQMWGLDRGHRSDGDVTLGIDHYSVQGALALALAVLPVLAALRADLRPFIPLCTSVAAFYLGLVSFAWPDAAGGLGRAWSIAAMAWGLSLLAATLSRRIRAVPLLDRPAG